MLNEIKLTSYYDFEENQTIKINFNLTIDKQLNYLCSE